MDRSRTFALSIDGQAVSVRGPSRYQSSLGPSHVSNALLDVRLSWSLRHSRKKGRIPQPLGLPLRMSSLCLLLHAHLPEMLMQLKDPRPVHHRLVSLLPQFLLLFQTLCIFGDGELGVFEVAGTDVEPVAVVGDGEHSVGGFVADPAGFGVGFADETAVVDVLGHDSGGGPSFLHIT